jgi:hypothetical protein
MTAAVSSRSRSLLAVYLVLVAELLLDETPVHLHVPRLVHHLGRSVLLRLVPGHGVDDLRGGEQRTLLAVEELAELPGDGLVPHALDLARVEAVPHRRAEDSDRRVGDETPLGIDVDRPVEPLGGVPLVALGVLVETR